MTSFGVSPKSSARPWGFRQSPPTADDLSSKHERRSLKHPTRAEVIYGRCPSLSQSINVATDFKRSLFWGWKLKTSHQFCCPDLVTRQRCEKFRPESKRKPTTCKWCPRKSVSTQLVLYCKQPGYRLAVCLTRPKRRDIALGSPNWHD